MSVQRFQRRSLLAFLAFIAIVALNVLAFRVLPGGVAGGLTAVGLLAGGVALGLAIFSASQARQVARIERGQGILARWTVDAPRWRAFVADFLARGAGDVRLVNHLHPAREPPESGVDVVFSADSVLMDGEIYALDRDVRPRATVLPDRLEVIMEDYELDKSVLLVPLARGKEDEAVRVARHINAWRSAG